jgi:Holliday junction DNA helicase RuvA
MIAYIEGVILDIEEKSFIILSGSIGYRVFSTPSNLNGVKKGEKISLHTYLAVRENALDLYGFKEKEELSFFELLITISGIGPKSALSILGVTTTESLHSAIISGDTGYLTKVSGIGRKTAEKIVLELKDKIDSIQTKVGSTHSSESLKEESDALLALMSLGYGEREAREALKDVSKDGVNTSNIVREALKILSK